MQHPQTILNKYDAYQRQQREQKGDAEPGDGKQRPDPERRARTASEELNRAADRNEQAQERLEGTISDMEQITGRSRNFAMDPELIDESAENFIAIYTLPSAVRFVRALLQRFPPDAVAEVGRFMTTLGTAGAPLADDAFAQSLAPKPKAKPRRGKRQSEPKGERHWDEPTG
jgi:hypothetical protein